MKFPFLPQYDKMDCGLTCLQMIANYYGKKYSLQHLRGLADTSREGISLLSLSETANRIGFESFGTRISFEQLKDEVQLPCIIHWNQNHYIVVYKITSKKNLFNGKIKHMIYVADPAEGLITLNSEEFIDGWAQQMETGLALILSLTTEFLSISGSKSNSDKELSLLIEYTKKYRKHILKLLGILAASSMLQLILPLLTQSIVDTGIAIRDINFIYLVLVAQVMVFLGQASLEIARSWLVLFVSTRINFDILSNFFSKLVKLPLSFFEVKAFGDITQRINDHHRIDAFLTGSSISFLFSITTVIIFSGLMAYYNHIIFIVFIVFTSIYIIWIWMFIKPRKKLDYKAFHLAAKNQSAVAELLRGMPEIKIAGAESLKRWDLERLQVLQFRTNNNILSLSQFQGVGSLVFNQGKIILITFLCARSVVNGQMTLGEMMAIQYLLGQLNTPIEQLIHFVSSYQEAKISFDRLAEIQILNDEEFSETKPQGSINARNNGLHITNVSFKYSGAHDNALSDINFVIHPGKTTAIVGMSGSGKTTLLKLLMKFYNPTEGQITVGGTPLKNITHSAWRKLCGVVLQDGYIFSDTIANNIAFGESSIDNSRLKNAINVANIQDLIMNLPLGLQTIIGNDGVGLSQGQKQRILIARAIYKEPDVIFFDEATSALDSTNESIIVQNLERFFSNRTVIIVAHRLSTVINANRIVVMGHGKIIEQGTHNELISNRSYYYELVKDQLNLPV